MIISQDFCWGLLSVHMFLQAAALLKHGSKGQAWGMISTCSHFRVLDFDRYPSFYENKGEPPQTIQKLMMLVLKQPWVSRAPQFWEMLISL